MDLPAGPSHHQEADSSADSSVLCNPEEPPPLCKLCSFTVLNYIIEHGTDVAKVVQLSQDHGLILRSRVCDWCGEPARLDLVTKAWRCDKQYAPRRQKKRRCNFKHSVFCGSWLSKAKLDIETNFLFVLFFVRDYFSFPLIQSELGLTNKMITDWASFCREVCIAYCLYYQGPIGGDGYTVEIDESKFGKRKNNVGRVVDGQWVFGSIWVGNPQVFYSPCSVSGLSDTGGYNPRKNSPSYHHHLGLLESIRLLGKKVF